MHKAKPRVIVLWEPLIMLALGTLIILASQSAGSVVRMAATVVTGLLFVSAGTTFALWLRNYRGD